MNAPPDAPSTMIKHTRKTTMIGIGIMLLGFLCMVAPLVVGMSVIILVGVLVLLSGIARLMHAYQANDSNHRPLMFLVGGPTLICGVVMLANPVFAAGLLTFIITIYLLLDGVVEVFMAFKVRPISGWGFMLISGVISFALGIMIWSQFPLSGPWAVGLLLGFKLFMVGLMMILVGSVARGMVMQSR